LIVRAVIFDFDGPINDSFREGLRRIKILCAIHNVRFGREERRRLTEFWGIPGRELLEQGLEISSELSDAMYVEWEKIDLQQPVPLVPSSKDVLYWLRRNRFISALLTTRNRENLTDILERLDLIREFGVISTRQNTSYRKPDPRAFRFVLETLAEKNQIQKENCIFIGDTPADIEAGRLAEIKTLVVQTGPYLLKHTLQYPIKLENLLNSIDELPAWLEEHHEEEIIYPYD